MSPSSFTGRARKRTTRRSVQVADRLAEACISFAGISTIGAVGLVCVFLVWVVIPLFLPEGLRRRDPAQATAPPSATASHSASPDAVAVGVDDQLLAGWALHADGSLSVQRLEDGSVISTTELAGGSRPTALSFGPFGRTLAAGFADGTVRTGSLEVVSEFPDASEVPELAGLPKGAVVRHGDGLAWLTPEDQVRVERVVATLAPPVVLAEGVSVRLIDGISRDEGPVLASVTEDGAFRISAVRQRENLITGEITSTLSGGQIPLALPAGKGLPTRLLVAGFGDTVLLAWDDGTLQRLDTRELSEPVQAETIDLLPEPEAKITALCFLNGRSTLVVGDSLSRVRAWFRTRPEGAVTSDGTELTLAHELPPGSSAVTALAASVRTRMLAAGFADGSVNLYHVTTSQLLASERVREGATPVTAVALSPKDDALYATTAAGSALWSVKAPHPEATVAALFGKVWYEGASRPEHVWQSSSGTDDFEPKLGLVPLVFGTLKATFYSLLFGAPLAILAALYSSEFLPRRTRSRIKPIVETMASLPSVVLGFLAALVIAPLVEGLVPQVLAILLAVPFALLLGAHLWQLIPRRAALTFERWRFVLLFPFVLLGFALGFATGGTLERVLFAGDVMAWLDRQRGSGVGGWVLLLMPLSGVLVALAMARTLGPWMARHVPPRTSLQSGAHALLHFLLGTVATVALAAALGAVLVGLGWDPRGGLLGTYVQRNALIVGVMMGFAVIPIIYTLADDALISVPDHLRGASLGAGATPWQTAMRIVIPTAMSGLFSALMVGLGRAVGETMIVLMAAGNTPVLQWNIFNGFRTLSANIAVELPEAVQGSTHFRTLFLAALVLFALTFVVNTVAEAVRQRFRKRAFEL